MLERRTFLWIILALLLVFGLPALACNPVAFPLLTTPQPPTATAELAPSPTEPAEIAATGTAVEPIEPTGTPTQPRASEQPTLPPATPLPATVTPTAPAKSLAATPAWPAQLVLTDAQVESLAQSNSMEGLQVQGLRVDFGQGTMTVAIDSIRYGFLSFRNITVEGHVTVANGRPTFHADRIQPRNLATAVLPGLINQFLGAALSDWFIESLRLEPGRLILTVRPA